MNTPRELGRMLASAGHGWRNAGDIGMELAPDSVIMAEAKNQSECVLTHDLDYGKLLAFSGDSAPSVVTFRLHRTNAQILFRRITDAWLQIESELTYGALVTIEDAAIRIRRLPFDRLPVPLDD